MACRSSRGISRRTGRWSPRAHWGAAAGTHDRVRSILASKRASGVLARVRDNALIDLGMAWADIHAATLLVFHAARVTGLRHQQADLVARLGKAHGVDVAYRAVNRIAPLVGTVGFQRHHPIMKARLDLAALQYADGIHDSLYRSGGEHLLRDVWPVTVAARGGDQVVAVPTA